MSDSELPAVKTMCWPGSVFGADERASNLECGVCVPMPTLPVLVLLMLLPLVVAGVNTRTYRRSGKFIFSDTRFWLYKQVIYLLCRSNGISVVK